jgi:hypothetical protein
MTGLCESQLSKVPNIRRLASHSYISCNRVERSASCSRGSRSKDRSSSRFAASAAMRPCRLGMMSHALKKQEGSFPSVSFAQTRSTRRHHRCPVGLLLITKALAPRPGQLPRDKANGGSNQGCPPTNLKTALNGWKPRGSRPLALEGVKLGGWPSVIGCDRDTSRRQAQRHHRTDLHAHVNAYILLCTSTPRTWIPRVVLRACVISRQTLR